ncbi:MAG: patatin-like phospholipase family protein [Flavobacteriaceae bacterium]
MINTIALCFSGGGYRAACFSLGTLSFFKKVGLLDRIKAISTVSGGTITGVKFAQSQTDGQTFDDFFEEYYKWLKEDKLAEYAIRNLKGYKVWKREENKHKRKNPINSFAIEYNKFTNQMTLGEVQDAIEADKIDLERVVFNATDFTHAMRFRFQNTKGNRKLGNNKIAAEVDNINEQIGHIKLGDILASSSAFPGGFEPIGFPNDFFRTDDFKMEEVGLLDGGIVDNQGISSLLTSNKPEYDLYCINDVSSPYAGQAFKFASRNTLIKILTYLSSLPSLILFLAITVFCFINNWMLFYSVALIITTVMIAIQAVLWFASRKVKKEAGILERLFLPPRRLGFYLVDRVNSILQMTSEVFLKNNRRAAYTRIYSRMHDRIATSAIYELRCDNDEGKPENQNEWDEIKKHTGEISELIKEVSRKATSFGTTLWFSPDDEEKNMLDAVIACGEFTACYNMITHFVRNLDEKIQPEGEAHEFFNELLELWRELANNPYLIVEERKKIFK